MFKAVISVCVSAQIIAPKARRFLIKQGFNVVFWSKGK